MIYGMGIFCDDPIRQRYVGGNNKITLLYHFYNGVVRFIGTGLNYLIVEIGRFAKGNSLVRKAVGRYLVFVDLLEKNRF